MTKDIEKWEYPLYRIQGATFVDVICKRKDHQMIRVDIDIDEIVHTQITEDDIMVYHRYMKYIQLHASRSMVPTNWVKRYIFEEGTMVLKEPTYDIAISSDYMIRMDGDSYMDPRGFVAVYDISAGIEIQAVDLLPDTPFYPDSCGIDRCVLTDVNSHLWKYIDTHIHKISNRTTLEKAN